MSQYEALLISESPLLRDRFNSSYSCDDFSVKAGSVSSISDYLIELNPAHISVIFLDTDTVSLDEFQSIKKCSEAPLVLLKLKTSLEHERTLQYLEHGALSIIELPTINQRKVDRVTRIQIKTVIEQASKINGTTRIASESSNLFHLHFAKNTKAKHAILLGAETGGVESLLRILPQFPASSPGIVLIQHLPETLIDAFAERVNQVCSLKVSIARYGDPIRPGTIHIAPCGMQSLALYEHDDAVHIKLSSFRTQPEVRQDIDTLFISAAETLKENVTAVLLVGLGDDGIIGLKAINDAGGSTFVHNNHMAKVTGRSNININLNSNTTQLELDDIPGACIQSINAKS